MPRKYMKKKKNKRKTKKREENKDYWINLLRI